MTTRFEDRLNQVIDRLLSRELLANVGLGNEIGFYIFDYEPEHELHMRAYLQTIEDQLPKRKPDLRFVHINLFQLIIDYLKDRKLLDKSFQRQKSKGDEALLKALSGPLEAKKMAEYFVHKANPEDQDLILLSGIGSAWPLIRSHSLLNSLHPLIQNTPLVIFYPGKFDGQGLRLFGRLKQSNYYRAFRLVA
ncbi:DUF1788 domain-containing protein [Desulfovermiculus halophilus]|uniref:DUF1788 domain-containing protein n=1 Tax=Desulfovermiculus halophilus TaxID=339722 RepID=UPI000486FB01|nr:DUF1788 domain-containing protein [Desulfovermiculus halophilus]